jgi:hypothetical protein
MYVKPHPHNTSHHLYGTVPWNLISRGDQQHASYLLYVEQLTSGVGLRDVFWDPGAVITQSMVYFELLDGSLEKGCNRKLLLKAPQLNYRDAATNRGVKSGAAWKSFAQSLLWSFDVEKEDENGVTVSLSDFMLHSIGSTRRNGDLNSLIRKIYGSEYSYSKHCDGSVIDATKSTSNAFSISVQSHIAYQFVSGKDASSSSTPPSALEDFLPLATSLIVGVRRTLMDIHKFDTLQTCSCTCCGPSTALAKTLSSPSPSTDLDPLSKEKEKKPFRMRPFHPKSGFNLMSYMDERQPLQLQRQKLYITRQHIVAVNVSSQSEEKEPFVIKPQTVFAVSSDAPPLIRQALVEGIQWWDHAFQYAGKVS